jgi:hypothetical protein
MGGAYRYQTCKSPNFYLFKDILLYKNHQYQRKITPTLNLIKKESAHGKMGIRI